jgi:hypothetical protein
MGSRRETEGEGARPPALSRRAILAATSVAAFGAAKAAAVAGTIPPAAALATSDEGTRPCANWLAIDAKIARLQKRWSDLESWLAKEHAWFQLSPAEQQALPWAKELHDIDGCLDVLFEKREVLLASLPTSGSASLEPVIARLAVVERLIWPDEHPEAHALIAGARQDLVAMSGGHSHSFWAGTGTSSGVARRRSATADSRRGNNHEGSSDEQHEPVYLRVCHVSSAR